MLRDGPLSCPTVFGRADVLEVALSRAQAALAGAPRTIVLAGEAGIGKTRVVSELIERLVALGSVTPPRVLTATCFEADHDIPYAPFIDLLQTDLLQTRAEPFSTSTYAARLDASGSSHRETSPDAAPPVFRAGRSSDDVLAQRRLHEALALDLFDMAGERPLIVIIEDLHWTDDASLELLGSLHRRRLPQPALLLLTYRTEEAPERLLRLLAELERQRAATELQLAPLDRSNSEKMVAALLGERPSNEFFEAVYALAEGNPYVIEEIVRSALLGSPVAAGTAQQWRFELQLPRSIQIAIHRRLDRLAPEARQLVTLASVAGRRFDFDLLQALSGVDEPTLVAVIRRLIDLQLVIEETPDVFVFRHALTQQAVYSELLGRERKQLHRATADALLRLRPELATSRPGDLAHHYSVAEEWEQALRFSRAAAEQAHAVYSYRAAAEHLDRALAAAAHLRTDSMPELYALRARAHELGGAADAAMRDYEALLAFQRAADDQAATLNTLLALGRVGGARDPRLSTHYFDAARELAHDTDDPRLLAPTLNVVGNRLLHANQPAGARRDHLVALSLFRELGDEHGQAATLNLLSLTHYLEGDLAAGVDCLQAGLALLSTEDDPPLRSELLRLLGLRGGSLIFGLAPRPDDDSTAALRDGRAALDVARLVRWRTGETVALMYHVDALAAGGDYARALPLADELSALAAEIDHLGWAGSELVVLGLLYADLCAEEHSIAHFTRGLAAIRASGSDYLTLRSVAAFATALVELGRLEQAASELSAVLDAETPMTTLAQRQAWFARAELLLAADEVAGALAIIERIRAHSSTTEASAVIPRLWWLWGRALTAAQRPTEAVATLLVAEATAARQRARPQLWRIQLALGHAYQAADDGVRAKQAWHEGRQGTARLADSIPDAHLAGHFRTATSARFPPAAPAPRRSHPDELSRREHEVADLIAAGHSNRAIAERLYLSERTVEKHLEHIRAKLGFTSRAQIAVWAVRHPGFPKTPPT